MIKEVAGWRMYWPEYNVKSLEVLERGKAYFVHSLMENSDLMFGPCWEEEKTTYSGIIDIPDCWNQPAFTPVSHVFAIPEDVLVTAGIGSDWMLGAFNTAGLCCGTAPAGAFHLTVFADDPSTGIIEGMQSGEPVNFRAWNPEKQKETALLATFDQGLPNQGNFTENGISVIKSLKSGTTGIDQLSENWVHLYPNPATGRVTIETTLAGKFQVEISDTKGSVLFKKDMNGNTSLDVASLEGGVYSLKISGGNTIIIRKLLIY
jgi:hypothetical protein